MYKKIIIYILMYNVVESQVSLAHGFGLEWPLTESIYLFDSPPPYFLWGASEGANLYDILGLKQGQTELETWVEGLTETKWEVDREFGFGRWYWFVRANHETGSVKSATQNFEILQSLETPGPLEGIFPGDDEVIVKQDSSTTFQWTTSSNATRYEVTLAKDGESGLHAKSSNLAINEWAFHEPLESGKWYWQVKAFNWLGQSETEMMTFEIVDTLSGSISTHQQNIPTGWSALNSNLNMEDDRIVALFPDAPEGFLFFKCLSVVRDGVWDVNQVQFGEWNFEGQRLAAGESGLVFNPGKPFEVSWSGIAADLEGFSGYWSSHTMIGEEVIKQASNGHIMYQYVAQEAPLSQQFHHTYPNMEHFQYVVLPGILEDWSPVAPVMTGGPNEIWAIDTPVSSNFSPQPDRHVGNGVYLNNYVPAFGLDAPIGEPRGCSFRGGGFWDLIDWSESPSIQINMNSKLSIQSDGMYAGYVDFKDGLIFSDVDWDALEEYGFHYDRSHLLRTAGYQAPSPPVIHVGLQPTWVLNPTIGYYSGLVPRALNRHPENVQVFSGENLQLELGLCEFTSPAAKIAWEALGDRVQYFLEKQAVNDSWEIVMSDSLVESFELLNLLPADSGIYRLGSFSTDVDPDCPVCFDAWQYGEPFTIEVIPATSSLPYIHIRTVSKGRNQIRRLKPVSCDEFQLSDSVLSKGFKMIKML